MAWDVKLLSGPNSGGHFFLGESAGAPWKTELLWTDGTGFLGWESVARLNTARLPEATDAVLEKTCFCRSLSIDQNRGRSKSRVPQLIGRMHLAGIEAATSAAAEATLRTCRSCGVHGRAGWAASRILPRHPLLHFKGGQPWHWIWGWQNVERTCRQPRRIASWWQRGRRHQRRAGGQSCHGSLPRLNTWTAFPGYQEPERKVSHALKPRSCF